MNYGRIERGPMAADHFTQISNGLFRDPRLSAKAKGIFGLISTHREGWGITVESIKAAMTDGASAIKTGLRELEQHGYLVRTRERRPDGTLGSIVYRITDMPRSEPEVDYPPVDEPPVADRPHKKTNSSTRKKTSLKEDLSPADVVSEPPAPVAAAQARGEIVPSFQTGSDLEPLPGVDVYAEQLADTASAAAEVTTAWADAYKRTWESEPTAKRVARVRDSAASRLRAGKTVDELLLIAVDMAETSPTYTDLGEHEAHWLRKQRPLAGTDAAVQGWLALAGGSNLTGGVPASRPGDVWAEYEAASPEEQQRMMSFG